MQNQDKSFDTVQFSRKLKKSSTHMSANMQNGSKSVDRSKKPNPFKRSLPPTENLHSTLFHTESNTRRTLSISSHKGALSPATPFGSRNPFFRSINANLFAGLPVPNITSPISLGHELDNRLKGDNNPVSNLL